MNASPHPARWRRLTTPAALTAVALLMSLGREPVRAADEGSLPWSAFPGGGGSSFESFYSLDASFGLPAASESADDLYTLQSGFWPASLKAAPSLTTTPQTVTVSLGDPVLFDPGATGDPPLSFQWFLNGVVLPNATNALYFISSAQLIDGGVYTVAVSNEHGSTISEPFKLRFALLRTAPENTFAIRPLIASTNFTFTGDNTNATSETGERRHGGKPGGRSVWYQWIAPHTGIATFHTTGSALDTLLAVYTGSEIGNLTPVAGNDDVSGRFLASEVRFNAVQNTAYQIAIDGLGGEEGEFVLSWALEVTEETLPVIVLPPVSRAVSLNGATALTVGAAGDGLTYQWFFNQTPLPGATLPTLPIPSFTTAQIGHYLVAITNALGRGVRSDEVALELGTVAGVVSYAKLAEAIGEANAAETSGGGGGGGGLFQPAAAAPGGFESVSVGTIDGHTFDNNNAIASPCASCGGIVGGALQTYILQPLGDGLLTIDTMGSTFDTLLVVYTNGPLSQICSRRVTCDNNSAPDGVRSLVSFPVTAGVKYLVGVDGVAGARGTIVLNWKLCLAPAPFELADGGLILRTPPNPLPYPDDPLYRWYRNDEWLGSTADPFFDLGPLPAETSRFSVRFVNGAAGQVQPQTNALGVFLAMAPVLPPEPGVQRIRLPGLTWPAFRVEAAATVLTNCDGGWLWQSVTNYTVSTQANSLVLTLPVDQPNRIHRLRPGSTSP